MSDKAGAILGQGKSNIKNQRAKLQLKMQKYKTKKSGFRNQEQVSRR